jgi:hypothetical protein
MRDASVPQVKAAGPGNKPPVSPQQKMANIFQQIDTAGSGRISKAQFEQAFNKGVLPPAVKAAGVDAAFSKLDPSGSGSVSKQDFIKGMEAMAAYGVQPKKDVAKAAEVQAPAAGVQVQVSGAQAPAGGAQAPAASVSAPTALSSAPIPPANGPLGNTINITA